MSKEQSSNIHCIYKHTSPSGKSYIGQTSNYRNRCIAHKNNSKCPRLFNAIKKYGWENFIHEIIEDNLSLEEANKKESHYIEFYNSLSPYGYNLKTGGENCTHSEETKEKMRETRKFCSQETREKRSNSQKGRKHSEYTK